MRVTYNQPSKQIEWGKWIFITLCILIVTCLVYGILLYNTIQKNKTAGFDDTIQWVIEETDITEVISIERYHGEKAYHIVYGTAQGNKDMIAFVPLYEKGKITTIEQSNIFSREMVEEQWYKQCNACKLSKITPGIENEQPVWELTYLDESNRHVFEYLSIYDGSQYEKISFTQMYQ